MNAPTITYLNAKTRKAIAALRTMTSKDRPPMKYIFTAGRVQAASNGFAAVLRQHDEALPDECQGRKDYRFVPGSTMTVVSPPDTEETYPDLNKIIRQDDSKTVFEIALGPKLLRDVMAQFQDCDLAYFRFFAKNQTIEITGKNPDGETVIFASIMPMFADHGIKRPDWINISYEAK